MNQSPRHVTPSCDSGRMGGVAFVVGRDHSCSVDHGARFAAYLRFGRLRLWSTLNRMMACIPAEQSEKRSGHLYAGIRNLFRQVHHTPADENPAEVEEDVVLSWLLAMNLERSGEG